MYYTATLSLHGNDPDAQLMPSFVCRIIPMFIQRMVLVSEALGDVYTALKSIRVHLVPGSKIYIIYSLIKHSDLLSG